VILCSSIEILSIVAGGIRGIRTQVKVHGLPSASAKVVAPEGMSKEEVLLDILRMNGPSVPLANGVDETKVMAKALKSCRFRMHARSVNRMVPMTAMLEPVKMRSAFRGGPESESRQCFRKRNGVECTRWCGIVMQRHKDQVAIVLLRECLLHHQSLGGSACRCHY
jgi:hypothetical protein